MAGFYVPRLKSAPGFLKHPILILQKTFVTAMRHVGHGPAGSKELCAELQEGLSSFCRVIGQQAAKSCAQSFKKVFRLVVAKKGAASGA